MGRDINESGGRNTNKPNQKKKAHRKKTFFSIHLLESEKVVIREGAFDMVQAAEAIERFTDAGHTLKVKLRNDGNGYAATLTQGDVVWNEAISLSAFHISVEKAVIVLGMGLSSRYEDFPDLSGQGDAEEFDF